MKKLLKHKYSSNFLKFNGTLPKQQVSYVSIKDNSIVISLSPKTATKTEVKKVAKEILKKPIKVKEYKTRNVKLSTMTERDLELYKQQFDTLDNCIAYCSSEQHRDKWGGENCTLV